MQKKRVVAFIAVIIVGVIAGLTYGWLVNPPPARNTHLSSLRADYRADVVLMIAEGFAADGDLTKARANLQALNPDPLAEVRLGLLTAQKIGFSNSELQLIADLEIGLTGKKPQGSSQ